MPDLGDLIISAIRAKQAEQEIDAIQKENNRRRGITNYNPAPIEAFFNPDEPIGNMIFSGGANILRTRAITRLTDIALRKNTFVVLLHCGDTVLETALRNYYSEQGIYIVNSNRPYYDPFLGKNGKEIGRLVFDSKTRDYHLRSDARYYLEGVYEYLHCRNVPSRTHMFIDCPHASLLGKVRDAAMRQRISREQADHIKELLSRGKYQLPDIENFLSALEHQGDRILAAGEAQKLGKAVNLELAAKANKPIMIDILLDTNDILVNIIMNEVEALVAQGRRVLLIADGISPLGSSVLSRYVSKTDAKCSIVVSSEDVFSAFGGDRRAFNPFLGKCTKALISSHASPDSCEQWSYCLGKYEKQEVQNSYSRGYGHFSESAHIRIKQESVVKPQELQGITPMDVFIKNNVTGELAFTHVCELSEVAYLNG